MLGLMCCFGIELLSDNISEARENILAIFCGYSNLSLTDTAALAVSFILSQGLLRVNALTMQATDIAPITFVKRGCLG
ncbi:hypothetical protein [Pseudorhodobacter aquimaris]|uniref:hypothetical protein n=1 Tax=Pseudorhodobacter aquimaris TaxID=687412 RepID=UPI0012ED6420|nr:hypothetical protein [Pseudorhodobacter aquimaris]